MEAGQQHEATEEQRSLLARLPELARRPELGAVGGLIVVTLFFLATADKAMFSVAGVMNFLSPAAQLAFSPSERACS